MHEEFRYPGIYVEKNEKIRIPRLNILLFIATFLSTYLLLGIFYSISIMTILLAHELGHYFACRAYKIPVTFPLFIPFPFSPFGTLGAIIKMKGNIPDRRALFDIGVAGPIMGLVFAIPAIAIGLKFSTIVSGYLPEGTITMGEPYIFQLISWVVIGPLPEGSDVIIHPIAYAGWAGLFVTALNLLPVGQLDGGHIIYAIGRRASKKIYTLAIAFLIFITVFVNVAWILLVILILVFVYFIGVGHPPTLYDDKPIGRNRMIIGMMMMLIFYVSFTPEPLGESISLVDLIKYLVKYLYKISSPLFQLIS